LYRKVVVSDFKYWIPSGICLNLYLLTGKAGMGSRDSFLICINPIRSQISLDNNNISGYSANMDLFILRHGKAGQHIPGKDDAERAMTEKGKEEIAGIARWMAYRQFSFDIIATSPLIRARETAGIVAAELGEEKKIETWPCLSMGEDPGDICRQIARQPGGSVLLLVGHEPTLSMLISLIISGERNTAIVLAKGGLARLRNITTTGDSVRGELQWLLTSKQINAMKQGIDQKRT
jgi:phosphohistidine phosphatase